MIRYIGEKNQKEIEGKKGETILRELIPKIAKLAISLPKKVTKPIPILKSGKLVNITYFAYCNHLE